MPLTDFLKNISPVTSVSQATKKQMEAEAKFLRAFANSQLLLYYGEYANLNSVYGTIIRNTANSAGTLNLPRSTVSESYTAILADLEEAISGLPELNTQKYFANITAAKLLKARVLLNRGASGDYTAVVNLTKEIIATSPFALEPNVRDIF